MTDDESQSTEKTIENTEADEPHIDIDEELEKIREERTNTGGGAGGTHSESEENDEEIKVLRENIERIKEETDSSLSEIVSTLEDFDTRLKKLEQQNQNSRSTPRQTTSSEVHLEERLEDLGQELISIQEQEEISNIDRKITTRVVQAIVLVLSLIFLSFSTGLTISVITSAAPVIAVLLLTVEISVALISAFFDYYERLKI